MGQYNYSFLFILTLLVQSCFWRYFNKEIDDDDDDEYPWPVDTSLSLSDLKNNINNFIIRPY